VAVTAACTSGRKPGPGTERQPLPRLPELGTVALPTGFAGYERETAPYASRGTVHVDTAFFAFAGSHDLGGNSRCRAQVTVSRYDPEAATPKAHVAELGTKLCDSAWFVTQFNEGWRQPDPGLWTLEFPYTEVGFFGTSEVPAVGVLRFDAERGMVVGLWAKGDVYALDEAVTVVQGVAASVQSAG
jgi:hypothetical protein